MRRKLLINIGLLLPFVGIMPLPAQQFGANPPSIKWRQLKTDSINILFPKGAEDAAFDIAGEIQQLQRSGSFSLGHKFENPPIVLQTQTTNSNGYVGLGPYRSEFYLSAPMDAMDLGSIDWAKTLALHEYRHVIQYNNINRGVIRTIDWLLGDNARSLLSDMAVPNWFFEGDAVFNETIHSRQGRGRLPRFMNAYQVLDKDGKQYNYEKLRNGSYKDYIPGHYELGYLLVSYGYHRFGPSFWPQVIKAASGYKGLFYPFQKAIDRVAGISFREFRDAAFKDYFKHYRSPDVPPGVEMDAGGTAQHLSPVSKNEVINYQYPYPAVLQGKSGIIALKDPRKSTSRFVWLQGGQQKELGQPSISRNAYFGYNNGRIIYTRYQTNPRWSYQEYSDLECLNIHTGKTHRLTHGKRYFTPDISIDGRYIAASELLPDGRSAIVLLDRTGSVLMKWEAPEGSIYNYPKFFKTGKGNKHALLFLHRQAAGKMGIEYVQLPAARIDLNKPASHTKDAPGVLIPLSEHLLSFPVVESGRLYYSMVEPGKTDPYTLLMELCLKGLSEGKVTKPVVIGRTTRDMYQGYGWGDSVVASLQTAEGYRLFGGRLPTFVQPGGNKQKHLSDQGQAPDFNVNGFRYYLPLSEPHITDTLPLPKKERTAYRIRRYPLLSHPFHFHSLQPAVEDPVYSLDLLGQNILNTVQTKLSYSYNRVSQINAAGADLTIGAWYLQPYAHVDYSWNHLAADGKGHQYAYKELTSQLGLQLPLNFTGGRWQRGLYLSTALSQSNLYWDAPGPTAGSALKQIRYLYSRLQFSMYARQAMQQLYPRLGFNNYTDIYTPLDGRGARQWLNSATLYLPGILTTHSLRWNFAYQHTDTQGAYGYNSRFPFSRGYVRPVYNSMWKFGVDYDLPLCYPDFGFAGMAYFSRIRANFYYDQSYGFDPSGSRYCFGSVGGALFADMNIGNQYPITVGVRYNHLLNRDYPLKSNWEILLPIHLF